jgi:SAM-dependent methyltransferase
MKYDPIKKSLGSFFNTSPALRKMFYALLNLLLLRTWHVKKEFKKWQKDHRGKRKILDAGSGFGQYVYLMSHNSDYEVVGVDVKTEQIEDCSRFFDEIGRGNVDFEYADLTQYRRPETFDFILSVDVMEHILEDEKVFENFYHSLKKSGSLLISTPSDQGGSDVHDHDHESDGETSFIDEHVRDGYNIDDIQKKLKNAGFQRTEAYYNYGTPGKISWKISMKYPILLLNSSKVFFVVLPFYYLITFPFALILNYMDLHFRHDTGTGLIVRAWK